MSRRCSSRPRLAALAACLFLSGAGSLVLEICWSRLLKLVFGSTTLSVSTILVAYMLGLGLGGLLGGRLARRLANGVRAYGWLEIGIGLYALAVPFVLGLYPALHRLLVSGLAPWPATAVRFVLSLAVLLAPTLLMGATLPLVVAGALRDPHTSARGVALFYGTNTLGAVTGVLVSSFALFPLVGLRWTNAIGAGLDLVAGALALFALAPRFAPIAAPDESPPPTPAVAGPPAPGLARWNPPLLSYGLVGLTALTYEVAWTRALTMIFGSSIYAFATMLAAFLAGIALGSLGARRWLDRLERPVVIYAAGLALLGALALATVLVLSGASGMLVAVLGWIGATGPRIIVAGLGLSALAMLGPTLVLGALFPLLVRAASGGGRAASAAVGDVYFVNTVGSAVGAFLAGFVLIPGLGLSRTLGAAVAVNFAAAAAMLAWQREWTGPRRTAAAVAALSAAALAALAPPGLDPAALTRGAYYHPREELELGIPLLPFESGPINKLLFYRDGVTASISVHDQPSGRALRINGKPDASLGDMPTQVLCAHIPLLFGPPARDVLVIGYASGSTAGAVLLHEPNRLDVVEIEPAVVEASHFFDEYNHRPLENPATRLILDDGRTYLTGVHGRYDVVISEPSNPSLAGCASLFTREYFSHARRALRPGGRLLQWVQLYGLDPDGVRAVLAALRAEFTHVYAFHFGQGNPDLLLLASERPLGAADLPRWERLAPGVRRNLEAIGIYTTFDLWSLVRLASPEVETLARGAAQVNSDDSMFVELRAPWLLFESTTANFEMLDAFTTGALGVAEASGAPLAADEIGGLALAYAMTRGLPALAERCLSQASPRGASAAALTAEAALLRAQRRPPAEFGPLLDRALALDPGLFEARYVRARLLQALGRLDDALADADALVAAHPADPRARRLRVWIQTARGRHAEAWDDARAMLAAPAARFDPLMWSAAAAAARGAGAYNEAIRLLERFLSFEPFAVAERALIADAYERAGRSADAARARRDRQAAIENNLRRERRQARYFARFGSRERAIAILDAILAGNPDYEPARRDREALR